MTRLSTEAMEALANQRLLDAAPGQITGIVEKGDRIEVTSVLPSPFERMLPSQWLTVLSAVDGSTISSDVTLGARPDHAYDAPHVGFGPCMTCSYGRSSHFIGSQPTTEAPKPAPRLFTPQYPVLFRAAGERCSKVQYRTGGRVHLQCVRRAGHPQNHLMDVMDRDAKPGSTYAD